MNGTGQQLSIALLCVGVIAMGATQFLGSPWPGVTLCGFSLFPWGLETWLGRTRGAERQTLAVMGDLLAKHADLLMETRNRLEEHGQQISSLRSAASVRGALGG